MQHKMKKPKLPWYLKPVSPVLSRFLQWLESRGLLKIKHHISDKVARLITRQFLADTPANEDAVHEYVHDLEEEISHHPMKARKRGAQKTKRRGKSTRKKKKKKTASKLRRPTRSRKLKLKRAAKRKPKKKNNPTA